MGHWDEALEPLVSPEFVSELIGAYEMNNIGIQIKSPLQIYVDVARAAGGEAARVAEEFAAEVHAQAEAEAGHNHPGDEADAEDDLSVAPEDTRGSCTAIG